MPTQLVTELGYSQRRVRELCDAGRAVRVKRGWIAAPDAPAELVCAIRNGGVLTCVTQAKRLELWVTQSDTRTHIGVGQQGRISRSGQLCVHWNAPIVPRDPASGEDHIVNVLATVAQCLPLEDAFAVWESALNRELVDWATLQRFPFVGRARQLAVEVTPYADSGLESIVRRRLSRLRLRIRSQIWVLGHYVDFLIGERLILQIDGGTHVGAQRTSDIRHDATLVLHGYTVIRVSYQQVLYRWHEVQDLVMQAVAQGLARA